MRKILELLIILSVLPLLANCHLDANLQELTEESSPSKSLPSIPLAKSFLLSGETISLASLFTTDEYTKYSISNPDGYYDSNTQTLSIPKNLGSTTTQLILTAEDGTSRDVTVAISGLDESYIMEAPLSFGDENYPTAGTKLSDGTLLVSMITQDSTGAWEFAAIHRSTDNGQTWAQTDHYHPFAEGETHVLAMASLNSNVYSCGYQWDNNNNDAEHWYIRRSTDGGVNWSNVYLESTLNLYSRCQALAASPTTGYVYAAGYETTLDGKSNWTIKESTDQGQTWSTIYSQQILTYYAGILHLQISPDNTIWFTAKNLAGEAELYKGTYTTSWAFNKIGGSLGIANETNYQTYGELELIDNNTAYLSSKFGDRWNIKRTTDGGLTWSTLYSYPSVNSDAGHIEVLSDGTIVAIGTYTPSAMPITPQIKVVRSTDGGNTWALQNLVTAPLANGAILYEGPSNSVTAINSADERATNFFSTDSGATWTERSFVAYTEKFYSTLYKLLVLPSGNQLTLGWVGPTDKTLAYNSWFVGLSTDNGQSWSYVENRAESGVNFTTYDATYDSLGNIYVLGSSDGDAIVRKSTDSGASWTTIETHTTPSTYQPTSPFGGGTSARLVIDNDNVLYYGSYYFNTGTGKKYVEIRKGTNGGSSWSTIKAFPANDTTHKEFILDDFKASATGTLWLSGRERTTANASERVLYKSEDSGTTWTQVLRQDNTSSAPFLQIAFDSSGSLYLLQHNQIQKTADGGASWTITMDSTYMAYSMLITSSDDIFVLTSDSKIIKRNLDGTWLLINDQAAAISTTNRNHLYSQDTVSLYQLDAKTIGVHTRYAEQRVGWVDMIKKLKIAD